MRCLSFGGSFESSKAESGPCKNSVLPSIYDGHIETVEDNWLNICCMLD